MKKKIIIWIFILCTAEKAICLRCYRCSSPTENTCMSGVQTCSGSESEDSCMQLSYTSKKANQSIKHIFIRKCVAALHGNCKMYCKQYTRYGDSYNCKVSCCSEDLCNDGQVRRSSSSSMKNKIVLNICCVFIMLFVRTDVLHFGL